jgi:hypothetical protein
VGDTFTDPGASATDNVDDSVSVTSSGEVDINTVGRYTITYNAVDFAGNQATPITRQVIVSDASSPVITLSGSSSISVNLGETFNDPGATAVDSVDGSVSVTTSGIVDTNTLGTYIIRYNAVDSAGNQAIEVRRVVTVVDTTPPVITLLGSSTISINEGDTFTDPGATAIDNVDGSVSVTISGSVDTSRPDTYIIRYNAVDSAGNQATEVTRVVTVVDTTPPVITLSGSSSISVNLGETFNDPGATAVDSVDGSVSVTSSGSVDTSRVGTYIITYNAIDSAGNQATPITREVIVSDSSSPVITLIGNNRMSVNLGETFNDPGATAIDNVDGIVSVISLGIVDTNTLGTYIITYTAVNSAGNTATPITREVIVVDTTPPVITIIGDNPMSLMKDSTFIDPGASATDNVDGSVTVSPSGSVDTSIAGEYSITYTASDNAGNEATAVRRVMVLDISGGGITAGFQ